MNTKDNNQKKPFLCGGYTEEDWAVLNGSNFDMEYYDDYCETPQSRTEYIKTATKPNWA